MTMGKLYSFRDHPEHEARLAEVRDQWIGIALRTEAQTDEDRAVMRRAIAGLYEAAKLEPPPEHRVVFVASPIMGAFVATTAACVWWLREHPEKHVELFGRALSEAELMAAIPMALSGRVAPRDDRATHAATHAATRAATHAATDAATHAATHAATDDATHAATDDATDDARQRDLSAVAAFYVASWTKWWSMLNGGNQWAGWTSYLSFFVHVAELDYAPKTREGFLAYEAATTHGGPRYMHARFCVVSDFPTRVCRDEQHRPHSASGPSIAWRDGTGAYYWHGIAVPREWIESPKTIDPKLALTHPNVEQRRCLAEILGWERVLNQLNARTIDKDGDALIGELVEVDIPDVGRERFLRVTCGTGRRFALCVPPATKTAVEAQAWIHDVDVSVIRRLEART